MIISVGETTRIGCKLNFGTHNGIFHCDEVLGIAILEMAHMYSNIHITRTRDLAELKKCDIVIDIGGGKFDHHIVGFNECRPNGKKYASAGLVWKEFGEMAIGNVAREQYVVIDYSEVHRIKQQIDEDIVIPIDREDNGEGTEDHKFSFIPKFLPTWIDTCLERANYDKAFRRVESIVYKILNEIIKEKVLQIATRKELQNRYAHIINGILEIPSQTMPWLDDVVIYNESHNHSVKFVIFPYPAGGWAAQCVPPSIELKFLQLVPFPKKWAGGNEETLPALSGVDDATFCHNGCFFVRAKSKQAIIQMCKIAMMEA